MDNGEMTEEQALVGTTYEFDFDDKGRLTLYYPVNKSIREASETTAKTIQAYVNQKIVEELERLAPIHADKRIGAIKARINQLKTSK